MNGLSSQMADNLLGYYFVIFASFCVHLFGDQKNNVV